MVHGRRRIASWMMVPFALLLTAFLFFNEKTTPETEDEWLKKTLDARLTISNSLSPLIKANKKPESGDFAPDGESEKRNLKINYTFDQELQKESETLLKRYKPDYAAIFMMDAKTGKILAMSSFEKANSQGSNLNLRATFPAASIFKIITASAAVDKAGVSPEHRIGFNGGNYTLYKKNVLSDKVNKWTRFITLKEAFARSINTAFGRLSLENLEPHDLQEYAQRFMFNQTIPTDFEVETSQATVLERGQILRPESAEKVRQMMEQTVLSGTSRKTFRKLVRDKKFKEVEMGGKTGHFTGMNPRGRTDWFVGYATDQDDKIAIAAVTVNIRKWTVKSSALGEMMFRKYFKERLEEKRAAKANAALKNRG